MITCWHNIKSVKLNVVWKSIVNVEWILYKNVKIGHNNIISVYILLIGVKICCVTLCWSATKLSVNIPLPLGKEPDSRPNHKKDVHWNAKQTEHLKMVCECIIILLLCYGSHNSPGTIPQKCIGRPINFICKDIILILKRKKDLCSWYSWYLSILFCNHTLFHKAIKQLSQVTAELWLTPSVVWPHLILIITSLRPPKFNSSKGY